MEGDARKRKRTGELLRKLYLFQIANSFCEFFAFNFVYLYLFNEGVTGVQISMFFLVEYGSCVAFTPLAGKMNINRAMRAGLVLKMMAYTLLLVFVWPGQLFLSAILLGAFITWFWVPFNTRFLELTSDENRAQSSAGLFATFAVMGAALPILSGALMMLYGFQLLLVICLGVLIAGACSSFWLPPAGAMQVEIGRMLSQNRRLWGLLLCEGLWQGVFWLAVPLGLLLFVTDAGGYGAFYSLLGLVGGIASVLAGRWSDRANDRKLPILLSAALGGAFSCVASFFLGNLLLWTACLGVVYFSTYLLFPFTFTVASELSGCPADAMTVREFLTNTGRLAGGACVLAMLLTGVSFAPAFALGGAGLLGCGISYALMDKTPPERRPRCG